MCDYILASSNYCQLREQLFVVNVGHSFLKTHYWKWHLVRKEILRTLKPLDRQGHLERYCCCFTVNELFGFKEIVKSLLFTFAHSCQHFVICVFSTCLYTLLPKTSPLQDENILPEVQMLITVLYVSDYHHPSA